MLTSYFGQSSVLHPPGLVCISLSPQVERGSRAGLMSWDAVVGGDVMSCVAV